MAKKIKLNITGMTCVNCAKAIEKVVSKIDGVNNAKVNFATHDAQFDIDNKIDQNTIISKIQKLGYDVALDYDQYEKKRLIYLKKLQNKLITAAIISAVIMTFEMALNEFKFSTYIVLVLAAIVLAYSGRDFFIHAISSIKEKNYDMNVLVALGSISAYIYSLATVFLDLPQALDHSYLGGAAMIITFVLFGKFLEEKAKSNTSEYLKSFYSLIPEKATILRDNGKNEIIPITDLNLGDVVIVKSGERIPADGIVIQGGAEIDNSMLTGESLPKFTNIGDKVYAGSINTNGFLSVKIDSRPQDNLINTIINLLSNASAKKVPMARLADKVSSVFVPTVISISILTLIVWLIFADSLSYALLCAISVLIISCPCALGLATPIAIITAISRSAKNGILIKNPEVIERISNVKSIAFDKTGTITKGNITVTKSNIDKEHLSIIGAAEALSEHPISKAILKYANENSKQITLNEPKIKNIPGRGIFVTDNEYKIIIGNDEHLNENQIEISKYIKDEGIIHAAINGNYVGYFKLADELRDEAKSVVKKLHNEGLNTVILTGDNKKTAEDIANKIEINDVRSQLLPQEKLEQLQSLKRDVVFVGDGVNDSLVLKSADIGIVLNSGTDIAKKAGDIVLLRSNLNDIITALKIGKITLKNIKQNLFWAFAYNAICIPVAAGALYIPFGIVLNPAYGAIAMCISSITVVLNSYRIQLAKLD